MKSTGVVRQLDNLGRIVLPIELRRTMGISVKDIVLRKYVPACLFCGQEGDVVAFKGKNICQACLEELRQGNL